VTIAADRQAAVSVGDFSNQKTNLFFAFTKVCGSKSTRTLSLAGAIDLSASRWSNTPIDLAKKWTGGGCGLRRLIGNVDNITGLTTEITRLFRYWPK
jgi:hypothetical protein